MAATVEESTPPDMATAIVLFSSCGIVLFSHSLILTVSGVVPPILILRKIFNKQDLGPDLD